MSQVELGSWQRAWQRVGKAEVEVEVDADMVDEFRWKLMQTWSGRNWRRRRRRRRRRKRRASRGGREQL